MYWSKDHSLNLYVSLSNVITLKMKKKAYKVKPEFVGWSSNTLENRKHVFENLPAFCHSKEIIMGFKDLKELFQLFHKQNCRLSVIVQVNAVLNRTVVVDSDWRFHYLCGSHLQSQVRWLPHRLSKINVTVNNKSPIHDYIQPADYTQPTYEMTPVFKPSQLKRTVFLTNLLQVIASSTIGHLSMTLASQQCFLVHFLYLSWLLHGIFKCSQTQPKYHHRWIVFQ